MNPTRARTNEEARRSDDAGFTLLEILIVVIIIGLLMTLVGTQLVQRFGQARADIARTQIGKVQQALEMYKIDNGRYPTTEQGLEALVSEPTSDPRPRRYAPGGYAKRKQIEDPWGMVLRYEQPGTNNPHSYDVWSLGADGTEGGEGENADVGNWDVASN